MSLTPVFPILQNPGTQDGQPWHTVVEGDAVNARNKGMVVVAKDVAGNARIPIVDDQNRLIVNTEFEDVVDLKGVGDHPGDVGTFQTICDITLQNSTTYQYLEWLVSCFREATFEIVHIDDLGGVGTETILGTPKVGSGSYTNNGRKKSKFTTGATGTQVLRLRAKNLNVASQLEGDLCIEEIQ